MILYGKWAVNLVVVCWLEEWSPALFVVPLDCGQRLALFDDVGSQWPHPHQVNFKVIYSNETTPVKMAIIRQQLLLVYLYAFVLVFVIFAACEQSLIFFVFIRTEAPQKCGPQVGDFL